MLDQLRKVWRWLIAGGLLVLLGVVDYLGKWGILSWVWKLIRSSLGLIADYWSVLVLVIFVVSMLVIWRKVRFLEEYVGVSFKDDFKQGLKKNWAYHGKWELVHGGELSVTQSEIGGITSVGHLWRDYRFEFTAIIVHDRIGWIVRAQDLFNYYMIQLTPTMVRPHLRLGGKWILLSENPHSLSISLNQPIVVRTDVRGLEARIYVNGKEVYYNNELFSIKFLRFPSSDESVKELQVGPLQSNVIVVPAFTTGRVGFRLSGPEHGRFSQCRVRPL